MLVNSIRLLSHNLRDSFNVFLRGCEEGERYQWSVNFVVLEYSAEERTVWSRRRAGYGDPTNIWARKMGMVEPDRKDQKFKQTKRINR